MEIMCSVPMRKNYTKGSQKSVVRSISVPGDLNEQMKLHVMVNWSEVACEAFRRTLQNLKKGKLCD